MSYAYVLCQRAPMGFDQCEMQKILVSKDDFITLLQVQNEREFFNQVCREHGLLYKGYSPVADIIPNRGVLLTLWVQR